MKINFKSWAIAALLLLVVNGGAAQFGRALPILDEAGSGRAGVMGVWGRSYTISLYDNPAHLVGGCLKSCGFAQQVGRPPKLAATYRSTLYDTVEGLDGMITQQSLSAGYRWSDRSAVFAGARYYSGLPQQAFDMSGRLTGSFRPYDYTIDLGYAHRLTEQLSGYASVSYVSSYLGRSASAFAGSLGLFYHGTLGSKPYTAGVRLVNLGPSFAYSGSMQTYALPQYVELGGEMQVLRHKTHGLALSAGGRHYYMSPADATELKFGGEYSYARRYYVRLGSTLRPQEMTLVHLGLGLNMRKFGIDITYNHGIMSALSSLSAGVGIRL